jgi:hypothetical protein
VREKAVAAVLDDAFRDQAGTYKGSREQSIPARRDA